MKKLLMIMLAACLVTLQLNAQNKQDKKDVNAKDVPQAVKSAFESQFANAADVEWKMKNGSYKAKFEQNDLDHFAEFNNSGELVSHGTEVKEGEIPAAVSDAIKTNYSGSSIDDVYRVEKKGQVKYMVKLNGNNKKLVFDEQGKLVKEK